MSKSLAASMVLMAVTSLTPACRSRQPTRGARPSASAAVAHETTAAEQVVLSGSFERVSRAVAGTASVVRRGSRYYLTLKGVTVAQQGMVRVYLVGHERASSTRILDETEMKYDMGELERGVPEQRIELPSEPDPALRSVVLFYPSFGVNLAVAPLREVSRIGPAN